MTSITSTITHMFTSNNFIIATTTITAFTTTTTYASTCCIPATTNTTASATTTTTNMTSTVPLNLLVFVLFPLVQLPPKRPASVLALFYVAFLEPRSKSSII